MGSDSQAGVTQRASGTLSGFVMPALPAASADSSMSAVELFCRNGTSSTRSSLDSQEQQSGRTPSLPAPNMLSSSTPSPCHTVHAAAAAASAAAAAFRAMYAGTTALGGQRASLAIAPVEAVQLTIQPLDMTSRRPAAVAAGPACAAAADALRALSGCGGNCTPQSACSSGVLELLRRASNAASSEATEQQGAEGSMAGCTMRTTSGGGGQSSDDTQSRAPASARHQLPTSPSIDTDGPQSRAALATANRRSALLRFRRKREARTFDKKVRYASRKRLAEARPRVRGQFVKAEVAAAFFAAQKAGTASEAADPDVEPMDVSIAVPVAC